MAIDREKVRIPQWYTTGFRDAFSGESRKPPWRSKISQAGTTTAGLNLRR
jgi:hypothetical protein